MDRYDGTNRGYYRVGEEKRKAVHESHPRSECFANKITNTNTGTVLYIQPKEILETPPRGHTNQGAL